MTPQTSQTRRVVIINHKKAPPALPTSGFIRTNQLLKLIPISKSTLWRKVKDGTMPAPVKLSECCTAWRSTDIAAWMTSRSAS